VHTVPTAPPCPPLLPPLLQAKAEKQAAAKAKKLEKAGLGPPSNLTKK
jgi:hypothetical protein